MVITRAQIQKQLVPGLNKVLGLEYGSIDDEHEVLFETDKSSRSFEEDVMFTGLGAAPVKQEGAAVQYDDMQETWSARYNHETIALAFPISQEAIEDNLYDTWGKARAKFLGRALAETKQLKAAAVFNNGFSTSFVGGDGQPLFSTTHPTLAAGNQSNKVSTDLSEAALETADINISLFEDDRGILVNARCISLHIPPALKFTAHQILKSTLSVTTATAGTDGITNVNDTNALRDMSIFPKGIHVNHRFTDTDAWFIKTNCPNGTRHFVRVALQARDEGDFDTDNMRYKARERYSFGWSNWRGWYGSEGA